MSQQIERFVTCSSRLPSKWMAWLNNRREKSDSDTHKPFGSLKLENVRPELCWHLTYSPVTSTTCCRNVYLLNCCIHWLSMLNKCLKFHLFVHVLNVLDVKLTLLCVSLSPSLPHQFHNNGHMTFGAICLFHFLALVIHPNASARPNCVTFVLLVRHAHFSHFFSPPVCGPLSLSSRWLWKVFSEGRAAGPQSAHTGCGYARAHWLKWKNKAFGQAAVGREWSSHCSSAQNNPFPCLCVRPAGMEEAVVCSAQWPSDGRPRRVGVLQKWPCQEAHSRDWSQLVWAGVVPHYCHSMSDLCRAVLWFFFVFFSRRRWIFV